MHYLKINKSATYREKQSIYLYFDTLFNTKLAFSSTKSSEAEDDNQIRIPSVSGMNVIEFTVYVKVVCKP